MNEYQNNAEASAEAPVNETNLPASSTEGNPPMPVYTPRERYPKRRAGKRDLLLAGALLALCFLLWDAICWSNGLGLLEAFALVGLLPATLLYLQNRPGQLSVYGRLCAGLYCLGALSLALSGDGMLKFLTVCIMIPLYLIVFLERLKLRTGSGLRHRIHDLSSVCFSKLISPSFFASYKYNNIIYPKQNVRSTNNGIKKLQSSCEKSVDAFRVLH